eukprot:TRINITY_DN247_c0_g1_i1.p1 TRINITY_DN247_c0_g1~~TRINITY_DN247_c0_g1_i1.p1  ORF type:complete len:1163 (-),score=143.75 TRINITY_DN247_c0_g1_i1:1800-5288(-)
MPEAVHRSADGWLVVEYSAIVPVLIEALKMHSRDLEALRCSTVELQKLEQSYSLMVQNASRELAAVETNIARHLNSELKHQLDRRKPKPLLEQLSLLPKLHAALIAFGAFIILSCLLAISIGTGVGIRKEAPATPSGGVNTNSLRQPAPRPIAVTPPFQLNWNSVNFQGGGFEDPTLPGWAGAAEALTYTKAGDIFGPEIFSTAPEGTGEYLVFINATAATASSSRSVPVAADAPIGVYLSVWVFLSPSSSFQLSTSLLNSSIAPCSSSSWADEKLVGKWQQVQVLVRCQNGAGNQQFRITLRAGSGSQVALDGLKAASFAPTSFAFAGDMDPTFGTTSLLPRGVQNDAGTISSMKYTSTGQVIVASLLPLLDSPSLARIKITRLLTDLQTDVSFGDGGSVSIIGLYQDSTLSVEDWIDVDSSDRILVAGSVQLSNSSMNTAVLRLLANGSIDSSFGGAGGFVRLFDPTNTSSSEIGFWIKSFPNSKIYVASMSRSNQMSRLTTYRLSANGVKDPYGVGTDVSGATYAAGCAVDEYQSFYCGLGTPSSFFLYKFLPSGALDSTYGSYVADGVLVLPTLAVKTLVPSMRNGTLWVGGSAGSQPFVILLDSTGQVALTNTTDFSGLPNEQVSSIRILADNTSCVLTQTSPNDPGTLWRMYPNGTISSSGFGNSKNLSLSGFTQGSTSFLSVASSYLGSPSFLVGSNYRSMHSSAALNLSISTMSIVQSSDNITHLPETIPSRVLGDPSNNRLWVSGNVIESGRKRYILMGQRLDTGEIDTTFAVGGRVWADNSTWSMSDDITLDDLVLEPDGCIVYAITIITGNGSSPNVYVIRRSLNGTVLVPMTFAYSASIHSSHGRLVRLPSGGYLVVSSYITAGYIVINRLLPNLTSDPSFYTGSRNFTINAQLSSPVHPIYLPSDGGILLSGTRGSSSTVGWLQKLRAGTNLPDSAFAGGGPITFSMSGGYPIEFSAAVAPDATPGVVFVAGTGSGADGIRRMLVTRVNATTGGGNGWVSTGLWDNIFIFSEVLKMEWDPVSQKIIIFGITEQRWTSPRITLIRLDPHSGRFDCFGNSNGLLREWAYRGFGDATYADGSYFVTVNDANTLRTIKYRGGAWSSCGSACGNGIIDPGEGCDDGNVRGGDGCSSSCSVESGFSCPMPGAACV